jgi:hypothetical protein
MTENVTTGMSASVGNPVGAARSLADDAALIGGIAGGVVALLLVGGLIAFFVARSRQSAKKGEPNDNGAALQPVRQNVSNNDIRDDASASHRSNYDAIALSAPAENNYGVGNLEQNYDAWSTKDDNYAKPSLNRTDYEDFTKVN